MGVNYVTKWNSLARRVLANLHWRYHEEAVSALNTPDRALIIYVNYVTVWLAYIVSNFNYRIDA